MSADCFSAKLPQKQIPAKIVYEDPEIFAFEDIGPQAPTHLLICPRNHIASLQDATGDDATMLGRLQLVATKLAAERSLKEGFRTVINTGEHAGQSVLHLHLHLLGGRSMRWPPG